jgi:hypothetical protein
VATLLHVSTARSLHLLPFSRAFYYFEDGSSLSTHVFWRAAGLKDASVHESTRQSEYNSKSLGCVYKLTCRPRESCSAMSNLPALPNLRPRTVQPPPFTHLICPGMYMLSRNSDEADCLFYTDFAMVAGTQAHQGAGMCSTYCRPLASRLAHYLL